MILAQAYRGWGISFGRNDSGRKYGDTTGPLRFHLQDDRAAISAAWHTATAAESTDWGLSAAVCAGRCAAGSAEERGISGCSEYSHEGRAVRPVHKRGRHVEPPEDGR